MDNGDANNNFVVNDEQIKIISKGYGNYIFLALMVLMSALFIIPGGEGSMMGIDLNFIKSIFNLVSENGFVHFIMFFIISYLLFLIIVFIRKEIKNIVLSLCSGETIIYRDKIIQSKNYLGIPFKKTIQLSSNPEIIVEENILKVTLGEDFIDIPFKSEDEKTQMLNRI